VRLHSEGVTYPRICFRRTESLLTELGGFRVNAQLDGEWLGSFYVITDVIGKELYSNGPCIRPGAFEYDSLSMTSVMT
jgi:hypothetical protein